MTRPPVVETMSAKPLAGSNTCRCIWPIGSNIPNVWFGRRVQTVRLLGLTGAPICLLEESPHPDARGPRVPGPPLRHVEAPLVEHDVASVEDARRRPDRDARLG